MNRRRFLKVSAGALASLAGLKHGCMPKRAVEPYSPISETIPSAYPFPFVEVSGTAYECGRELGKHFGQHIRTGLNRRRKWFDELRRFMEADLVNRYHSFLFPAQKYFPDVVSELKGWSHGSGVDFKDLVALNLKSELSAMMHVQETEHTNCSTIALSFGKKHLLAHNEDGDKAYSDLMFFVHIHQTGKPAFVCFTYPGILPGNGPGINESGLVMTTNFISSTNARKGIPRYFISRAALGARSLNKAVQIITHPKRAFPFHTNLAWVGGKKILSVETSLDKYKVHLINGLYIHTNHLILPGMEHIEQDKYYVTRSSLSRYQVLEERRRKMLTNIERLGGDDLVRELSSHENAPYSPCRHPTGNIRGATLACSLFDLNTGNWTFLPGNPCKARSYRLRPFVF